MDMFLYIDKATPVHRLDPRTKLLLMLLSFVLALSFRSFAILSSVLVGVLLYGAAGGVLSNLRRIRVVLLMIAIFSVIIWSVATPLRIPFSALFTRWADLRCHGGDQDLFDDHLGDDLPEHDEDRGDCGGAGEAEIAVPGGVRVLHRDPPCADDRGHQLYDHPGAEVAGTGPGFGIDVPADPQVRAAGHPHAGFGDSGGRTSSRWRWSRRGSGTATGGRLSSNCG